MRPVGRCLTATGGAATRRRCRCLATSSHLVARAETATVPDGRAGTTRCTTDVEEAMADPNGQTRLPNPTHEDVLAAARTQAGRAAEQYAQLLAAEAGIAARALFADVARLVFRLTEAV